MSDDRRDDDEPPADEAPATEGDAAGDEPQGAESDQDAGAGDEAAEEAESEPAAEEAPAEEAPAEEAPAEEAPAKEPAPKEPAPKESAKEPAAAAKVEDDETTEADGSPIQTTAPLQEKAKGLPDPLRNALEAMASLRLTVILLALGMLLIYSGTQAQIEAGIWDVQARYFRSWYVFGELHLDPYKVLMPGGYTLGFLLLFNLLAAHIVRFRFSWQRLGVILIHLGLIMLLVGELATAELAVESNMDIDEGQWTNFSADVREVELAIIDTSDPEKEHHVVIREALLRDAAGGAPITDPQLPFQIEVVKFFANSEFERAGSTARLPQAKVIAATHGVGTQLHAVEMEEFPGTDSKTDVPSAEVRFSKGGRDLGTYLTTCWFDATFKHFVPWNAEATAQHVIVDGKPYRVELRYKRDYKPYKIQLLDFSHDVYTGTNTPRNYSSKIRLVDEGRGEDREVLIYMNNPLRYHGETFFQSSFKNNDRTTVLQVVRNPVWTMPYLAVAIGSLGMCIHFGQNLLRFLRRRKRRAA